MNGARAGLLVLALIPSVIEAQGPLPSGLRQLNDFFEFRGRWVLDETETAGLPLPPEDVSATDPSRLAALEIARELVITTTTTEFSVSRNGAAPEVYKIDGSETQERDPRTGVGLDRFFRFTQVADAVALTRRLRRGTPLEPSADIVTDAYSVAGAVLTVERLRSVVFPPGGVAMMKDPGSVRMTIVYRRQAR